MFDLDDDVEPVPYGIPYRLKYPVEMVEITGGEEVKTRLETITLRRPTGVELTLLDQFRGQPMELLIQMLAACSGEMVNTIRKLDWEDLLPLGVGAMASSGGGRKPGASR